jgi:hypothetical protein
LSNSDSISYELNDHDNNNQLRSYSEGKQDKRNPALLYWKLNRPGLKKNTTINRQKLSRILKKKLDYDNPFQNSD